MTKTKRNILHKMLLCVLKYTPMFLALCCMINTIAKCKILDCVASVSLVTWIFIYIASVVFEFCSYHRMFLWYLLLNKLLDMANCCFHLQVSTTNLIRGHNILIGITLFLVLIMYVKNHKNTFRKDNQ